MYKKILLFLSLIILTGCGSDIVLSNSEIDTIINNVSIKNNDLYNVNSRGYRYYLPRNFRVLEENGNNQVLISEQYKYYLYVDIISYQSKKINKYEMSDNSLYGTDFNIGDKYGYIDISEKNSYIYIKMMYNYSMIEVEVDEHYVKSAVSYMSMILSSIKYNNDVINNIIGENILESKESKYEIFKPKVETEKKNILEYVEEYDNYYDNSNKIVDTDLIN